MRKHPSKNNLFNHIVIFAVNIILIFPTVLLNAISVITILKSSRLKNKLCYYIILMQSVADLAVGVLGIPLFLVFLAAGIGGTSNCYVATLAYRSSVLPIGVSILTLSSLTIERYIAVIYPLSYNVQLTKKKIVIYVCTGVVIMVSVAIISIAIEGLIKRFTVVLATLFFLSSAFVYFKIYVVVKKLTRSQQNKWQEGSMLSDLTRKKIFMREIKQVRSCFIVVLCFFLLCFMPVILTYFVGTSVDIHDLQTIQNWATTFSMSNSSINSIIFFWTKTMLKNEAIKISKVICSR